MLFYAAQPQILCYFMPFSKNVRSISRDQCVSAPWSYATAKTLDKTVDTSFMKYEEKCLTQTTMYLHPERADQHTNYCSTHQNIQGELSCQKDYCNRHHHLSHPQGS